MTGAQSAGFNRTAEKLGDRLGHRFIDRGRLERALTHASARGQTGSDYERLEFLGDRVLGLAVAEMLFTLFPGADEGELSVRLNALVNAQTLAEIGDELGLDEFVLTGADVKSVRGRKGANMRADVIEALIATIYLEGGLDAVRPVIGRFWKSRAQAADQARRDAKTELQEWAHRAAGATPVYVITQREGPDHDPVFTVEVSVKGMAPSSAAGRSKREAEQSAAERFLLRENVWQDEDGER